MRVSGMVSPDRQSFFEFSRSLQTPCGTTLTMAASFDEMTMTSASSLTAVHPSPTAAMASRTGMAVGSTAHAMVWEAPLALRVMPAWAALATHVARMAVMMVRIFVLSLMDRRLAGDGFS